jgi:hypothetical protein
MSKLDETINLIGKFIEKHKCNENIEIKFILGKYSEIFGFEKHLFHEENYSKIIKLLESCKTWEEIAEESDEKFVDSPEKIVDTVILSYTGSPYDILITAQTKKNTRVYNSETYVENSTHYTRKNHVYSLYNDNEQKFRFELNLVLDSKINNVYLAHSSILKLNDVINCCGKISDTYYLKKI